MRTVEFRRRFDDENAARVRFELDRNRVIEFVVQLECLLNDQWTPIVRYDTAHGFAHVISSIHHTQLKRRKSKSEISTKD